MSYLSNWNNGDAIYESVKTWDKCLYGEETKKLYLIFCLFINFEIIRFPNGDVEKLEFEAQRPKLKIYIWEPKKKKN